MTATFRWRGDPAVGHPQTRRHKCPFYASRALPALLFWGIVLSGGVEAASPSVTANAGRRRLLTSCSKTVGDHCFENSALALFAQKPRFCASTKQ